jgi:hypothetical protein
MGLTLASDWTDDWLRVDCRLSKILERTFERMWDQWLDFELSREALRQARRELARCKGVLLRTPVILTTGGAAKPPCGARRRFRPLQLPRAFNHQWFLIVL